VKDEYDYKKLRNDENDEVSSGELAEMTSVEG